MVHPIDPKRSARPVIRTIVVIALALFVLGREFPDLNFIWDPAHYGDYGFGCAFACKMVHFVAPGTAAAAANIRPGDGIDWGSTSLRQRLELEGSAAPYPGEKLTIHLRQGSTARTITLTARPALSDPMSHSVIMILLRAVGLVFITIGALLVLLRPNKMLWAFYLYALGVSSFDTTNVFWSFLPDAWFTAIVFSRILLIAGTSVWFFIFALRFPTDTVTGWRRWLEYAAPFIFMWLVYVWPYNYSYKLLVLGQDLDPNVSLQGPYYAVAMYAVAAIVLVVNYYRSSAANRKSLGWVMTALVVSYAGMHVDALDYVLPSIPNWLVLAGNVLGVVVPISVAYAVVRHRVFDITFVISRVLTYAAITLIVVAAFSLIDLILLKTWANLAIPVELAVAVWLGIRLSGLDDVAAALTLTETEAQAARARWDRSAERDALARALARVERTRNPALVATVRAHAAFGAWFAGEDDEFRRHSRALDDLARDKRVQGLRRFARCAVGKPEDDREVQRELPEWAARTHLVACGDVDDALEAWRQASQAVAAADASGVAFLRVIARVALAEFSVEERSDLYETAIACSREARTLTLTDAVLAVSLGDKHLGMLGPFVTKRLRATRPRLPTLEIRFADVSVRAYGRPVELKQRELSLLLSVSQFPAGASSAAVMDRLWPDLDGDAAHNALRVSLHRLRKALGDDAAVVRDGSHFRVREGAVVDLWSMAALTMTLAKSTMIDDDQRTVLRHMFTAMRSGRTIRPAQQEWCAEIERSISQLTRAAGELLAEDALARTDVEAARYIALALIDDDPLDEMPRGLAIRAYLVAGDRGRAVYEYNQYLESLARAALGSPSADLAGLVAATPG